MFARSHLCLVAAALSAAIIVGCPESVLAQRHGGHGAGGGVPGGMSRPDGVDDKDSLKDFHLAMAVQASDLQVAQFKQLLKETDAVNAVLQRYLHPGDKAVSTSDGSVGFNSALQRLRDDSRKFIEGFSSRQKSGLKNTVKKVEKADSSLENEQKKFDESLQVKSAPATEVSAAAGLLEKSLTEFSNQQIALGQEMGITLASADDVTFNLPVVKTRANAANRSIEVDVSGSLSQTAVQNGQRTFKVELYGNLSDLQHNVAELLRVLDRSNTCGENLTVRRAALTGSSAGGILLLDLHFERWACMRIGTQTASNELAESDGTVEVKLVPSMGPSNTLKLDAALGKINATGFMGEALRSGDLGDDIRQNAALPLLTVTRATTDLAAVLPAAIQSSVTLHSAKFQSTAVGDINLVLEGEAALSDQQAKDLARELNQNSSGQGLASR